MVVETRPFDPLRYVSTPERQVEYLRAALESGDSSTIALVIGDLVEARGVAAFSAETGLSSEAIHNAFRVGGNPTLEMLSKALKSLGLRLSLEPA